MSVDGQEVAQARIRGNDSTGYYIEMTFTTDYVENHSDISGTFEMQFQVNQNFVKDDGNIIIEFPNDDIDFNIEGTGEGGTGGGGIDSGSTTANAKTGQQIDVNFANPDTGKFDTPGNVLEWNIELGKETILGGKVNSFEDVESVIIYDEPQDQEMVAWSSFESGWKNGYAFQKAFYTKQAFEYGAVSESQMGLILDDTGKYYKGFEMDALPLIKEYEAKADTPSGSEFKNWAMDYYNHGNKLLKKLAGITNLRICLSITMAN